jgi:Protein kinase domain
VDGMNLRQLLETYRLTPRETLGIVPQICEALEYAHGEGIVHRDIKPENILLDQKGRVKVADFGLSKLLVPGPKDLQLTQSGQVLGTMHYMAPEQLEKPLEVDQRADIYSLGVLLYEMLTGGLPLGRFELPSKKAAVDARLDELVLHAMERDPRQRCQSASEVRMRLETIAGVTSRLSPEVSRILSYEYRSKATLFGWPLVHVAIGVNPATGRKRNARAIIAVGTAPRGIIAFGDVAVGVIACGIFGYGLVSFSVIAVGVIACGSVAAGLVFAMGGLAIAPVALGGLAFGWYANGAMAWGKHALAPNAYDPVADKFFNPYAWRLANWVFRAMLIVVPLFLALGFLPKLMARISERSRKKRFRNDESTSV